MRCIHNDVLLGGLQLVADAERLRRDSDSWEQYSLMTREYLSQATRYSPLGCTPAAVEPSLIVDLSTPLYTAADYDTLVYGKR